MNPKENQPKQKLRDNLFQGIFSVPENFTQLYYASSGKHLQPEDLTPLQLESDSLTRSLASDVAFITKDNRLIILIEHQSSVNPNMPARFLLYYAEYIRIWLSHHELELSSNQKIHLPEPEFYIAYNGETPYQASLLSLNLGEQLAVQIKLVDINYPNIVDKSPSNQLAGYAFFIQTYYDGIRQGLDRRQAFLAAQQMSRARGYLSDIIDKEEFMLAYAPIVDREKEAREADAAMIKSYFLHEQVMKMLNKGLTLEVISDLIEMSVDDLEYMLRVRG